MPATTSVDPRGRFSIGPGAARLTTTTELGRLRLHLVWLLVIVSLVPWRTKVYYSGGMDPTVVVKGGLAAIAFVLAWLAASQKSDRYPVGARSFTFVVVFATTTTLGGWASGSLAASAVLTGRVLLVATIMMLVLMTYPLSQVVHTLCVVTGLIGVVTAVAGAGSFASEGRLYGGIFPLNPNQIALLLSVPLLGIVWRMVHRRAGRYDILLLLLLGGVTWLTGSRTGLVALVAAIVVIVVQTKRLPVPTFLALVCAVPVTAYLVFSTTIASEYFGRGGEENVGSLSSRTIAWTTAFDMDTGPWQYWLGGGYAVKTIPVSGAYWDTQVLDSSWVSAYVQSGVFGMTLLGLWAVTTLVAVFRCAQPWRGLLSALVISCLIRSYTESGLLDSHVLFVIFFVASVAAERGSRTRPPIGGSAAAPAQSTELRRA